MVAVESIARSSVGERTDSGLFFGREMGKWTGAEGISSVGVGGNMGQAVGLPCRRSGGEVWASAERLDQLGWEQTREAWLVAGRGGLHVLGVMWSSAAGLQAAAGMNEQ